MSEWVSKWVTTITSRASGDAKNGVEKSVFLGVRGLVCICETQRFTDQKLSSSIFACRSFVRPDRWHLHLSQLYDVLDHTNHTWCMCGGIWWCLDHIWWCLVVSGACLVVSGARLVMLMDIDWYDLIWCIWADIFSNAYNRCTDAADAADALVLLMHWCYWSNDAAVVDKMQICVWAHLKGIALSSEFRTVVQRLVHWIVCIILLDAL